MRILYLLVLLSIFIDAKSETITTIGGTATTGNNSFLCLTNPFSNTSNVNSSSMTDYAQFTLAAGAGCNFYLHSTIASIGAAGAEAGFYIQTANLTSLLSGITLDTYLNGVWQESASGSDLLSLFNGDKGNIYFNTTKAHDAIRISFKSLVAVVYSVRIFWGYSDNSTVQTLPISFKEFTIKEVAGKAHLDWEVEGNNEIESITIEKSLDNQNYKSIATIKASAQPYYTYADQSYSKAWYRLKANFKNGKVVYSQLLYYASNNNSTINLFPNPVSGNFLNFSSKYISDEPIDYIILDVTGRKIKRGITKKDKQMDITFLKKGLYFFQTNRGESIQFLKQ